MQWLIMADETEMYLLVLQQFLEMPTGRKGIMIPLYIIQTLD